MEQHTHHQPEPDDPKFPLWGRLAAAGVLFVLLGWLLSWSLFTKIQITGESRDPSYAETYLLGLANYQLKNIRLYSPIILRSDSLADLVKDSVPTAKPAAAVPKEVPGERLRMVIDEHRWDTVRDTVLNAVEFALPNGCSPAEFLLQGKCVSCPPGSVWNGVGCQFQSKEKEKTSGW